MYKLGPNTQYLHLGLSGPSSKKLRVAITGFHKQALITIDSIKDAITKIPIDHLVGLTEITYSPRRDTLYPHMLPPVNILGTYDANSQTVNIADFKSPAEFFHTLFHEIGHFVYFRWLPQPIRFEWVQKNHKADGFISDYARTNASEDFAETYAFYILDKCALEKTPVKLNFFNRYIFLRPN